MGRTVLRRALAALLLLLLGVPAHVRGSNAPVVARGVRTCNISSPVLYASDGRGVAMGSSSLTVLLAPACTKQVLNTLLDDGVAGLQRLLEVLERPGGGSGGGGDSSDALAACSGVLGHVGADPSRHNEGHATIVTNKARLVLLGGGGGGGNGDPDDGTRGAASAGAGNGTGGADATNSAGGGGGGGLGTGGYIKILASMERADAIQRLMACDFAGDPRFVGAGNTSSSAATGGGPTQGPAAKKKRRRKRTDRATGGKARRKKRRGHVEL